MVVNGFDSSSSSSCWYACFRSSFVNFFPQEREAKDPQFSVGYTYPPCTFDSVWLRSPHIVVLVHCPCWQDLRALPTPKIGLVWSLPETVAGPTYVWQLLFALYLVTDYFIMELTNCFCEWKFVFTCWQSVFTSDNPYLGVNRFDNQYLWVIDLSALEFHTKHYSRASVHYCRNVTDIYMYTLAETLWGLTYTCIHLQRLYGACYQWGSDRVLWLSNKYAGKCV